MTPALARRFGAAFLLTLVCLLTPLSSAGADSSNAANRMVTWINCSQLASITDAQLDQFQSRGGGGFVCASGSLRGMGGNEAWTGNLGALSGSTHNLERALRDSRLGDRLLARGM